MQRHTFLCSPKLEVPYIPGSSISSRGRLRGGLSSHTVGFCMVVFEFLLIWRVDEKARNKKQ